MITDTHAHLYWKEYDGDREEVLARARAADVTRMVVVGTNAETSRAAFELCRGRADLFPTAGVHPHDAADATSADLDAIADLARQNECVALGETGLDFFRNLSPQDRQEELFRWHLELARELEKPVVIHCRDAHEAVSRILEEHRGVRGVMHCYTLGPAELEPYLELGLYISFSGVVTYPKNQANREAARRVPAERLLVETDCPFLPPHGKRGERNEPANARIVLEELARVRGEDLERLAERTGENAAVLFHLPR